MIPFIPFGALQIPTFFLVISVGLTILLFFLSYRVDVMRRDRTVAFNIALLMMFSAFLGGRILHVLYEEPAFYLQNPVFILHFWNGGFVFFGGLLLCLITGYIYARRTRISFSQWADFFTPIFSLGHAFGRVGCFLAGCCYGSYCQLPWAIRDRHPTTLYMIGAELLILAVLLLLEKRHFFKYTGSLFVSWLILHSFVRFWVEYYRDDFRGFFIRVPLLGNLSISQVISLLIIFAGILFFVWQKRTKSS